jgi:hypothetical protein
LNENRKSQVSSAPGTIKEAIRRDPDGDGASHATVVVRHIQGKRRCRKTFYASGADAKEALDNARMAAHVWLGIEQ